MATKKELANIGIRTDTKNISQQTVSRESNFFFIKKRSGKALLKSLTGTIVGSMSYTISTHSLFPGDIWFPFSRIACLYVLRLCSKRGKTTRRLPPSRIDLLTCSRKGYSYASMIFFPPESHMWTNESQDGNLRKAARCRISGIIA